MASAAGSVQDGIEEFKLIRTQFGGASLVTSAIGPHLLPDLIQMIIAYADVGSRFLERPLYKASRLIINSDAFPRKRLHHFFYKDPQNRHAIVSLHGAPRYRSKDLISVVCLDGSGHQFLAPPRPCGAFPRQLYNGKGEFVSFDASSKNVLTLNGMKLTRDERELALSFTYDFRLQNSELEILRERQEDRLSLRSFDYDHPTQSFLILTNIVLLICPSGSTVPQRISFQEHNVLFVTGVDHDKLLVVADKGLYFLDRFREQTKRRELWGPLLPEDERYGKAYVDAYHSHVFILSTKEQKGKIIQQSIKMFAFPRIDYRREFLIEGPHNFVDSFVADDAILILNREKLWEFHLWDIMSGDRLSVIRFEISCLGFFLFHSQLFFVPKFYDGIYVYNFETSSTQRLAPAIK